MKKIIKTIWVLAILGIVMSCQDLEVENTMEPDASKALSEPGDLIGLINGGMSDVFYDQHAMYGNVHYELQSDNLTATNNAYGFWHVADQPRRQLTNSTGYSEYEIFGDTWGYNNRGIANLNTAIKQILSGIQLIDEGEDVTQEMLANAYFARGVALGAIGMVYDRGYPALEETDLATLGLEPSENVIAAALTSFDRAIEVATAASFTEWSFMPIPTAPAYSKAYFIQLINSYAARVAISAPRNAEQAAQLDYAKILDYANKGITSDWIATADGNANVVASDINFAEASVGTGTPPAAYIPADQKIAWLFDQTQPKNYPLGTEILPPVTTNDNRADEYYFYTTDFGYLNSARGRYLFTNYQYNRYPELVDPASWSGTPIPYFLAAEIAYIKAECQWKSGNGAAALTLINDGPRSTVGGLTDATNSSDESLKHLLHYEYSIELMLTGKAITWAFMRRHNLLQDGTPLHFPVPAGELEIIGETLYTYGSPSLGDGVNTAKDGNGSWLE